MSVDSLALPMLKTGDSHLSPLAASSLNSVALVEIPPGSEMSLKTESCFVTATLTGKVVSGYREKRTGYIPVVLETFSCTLSFWAVILLR